MSTYVDGIAPLGSRDLRPEVFDHGKWRVRGNDFWGTTTKEERGLLGHLTAMYVFPTTELCLRVTELIAGRKAIEIGSGCGVFAEVLGIQATDSHQQEDPVYRLRYRSENANLISYGPKVARLDALRAIRKYRPQVVVAAWVTQKFDPRRPELEGNEAGVDEDKVLDADGVESYIFVGNQKVHRRKKIWARPHTIEYPDYVTSRAVNGSKDFIAVWDKK